VDVGVRLLRTAMAAVLPAGSRLPEYSRFVPPGWRDTTITRQTIQDRMTILVRTGELTQDGTVMLWPCAAGPLRAARLPGEGPASAVRRPSLDEAAAELTDIYAFIFDLLGITFGDRFTAAENPLTDRRKHR
jgi:hypothetical protein